MTVSQAAIQVRGVIINANGQVRACRSSSFPFSPVVYEGTSGVPNASGLLFDDGMTRFNMETPVTSTALPYNSLAPTWTVVDVTGDGLDDLVQSTQLAETVTQYICGNQTLQPTQYTPGTKRADVWVNTGTGWVRDAALSNTLPPFSVMVINGHIRRYDLDPRFVDLDGDGRLDLHVTGFTVLFGGEQRTYQSKAYRNTPTGWIETPALASPTPTRAVSGDSTATPTLFKNLDRSVRFADLNRDGLADLIKTTISGTCTDSDFTESGVWLNTGSGWCDGSNGATCSGAKTQYLPPATFQKEIGTCGSQSAHRFAT